MALWGLIVVLGLTSNLRAYSDIRAYAIGEASFLAPLSYLRLITIGIMGYAAFGETPDRATILGGAVIVAASLYIALREARAQADPQPSRSTLTQAIRAHPREEKVAAKATDGVKLSGDTPTSCFFVSLRERSDYIPF